MFAPRTPFRLSLSLALAAATAFASLVGVLTPAAAVVGGDRFVAGQVYRGEFGSPSVLLVDGVYYAYATNLDGNTLPVMTSRDLVTWRARPAWPGSAGYSSWRGFNDAFPGNSGSWADRRWQGGRWKAASWAPSVARIGRTYVDVYAVSVASGGRHCLSVATAPTPFGPFRDRSSGPLVCSSDPMGTIDPQIAQPGDGRSYLIWKNAGRPGVSPTSTWVRELAPDGRHLRRGTRAHLLLRTAQRWEGNVTEAPAMIRANGRFYLFYSGNRYSTSAYATGYAICRGPLGPCRRPTAHPLLATNSSVAGPGAGTPFLDTAGRLRFAYSAWRAGYVGYASSAMCARASSGCNQRRLHIATLGVTPRGRLTVSSFG